jgi:type I restriction enzyme M protein
LGYKWDKYSDQYIKSRDILNGQVPEILFIEQCLKLLKPNGRAGIVLPNGHFENSSLEYLRAYIKQKAEIIGVVLLPSETFIPYGTGVKASILFLRKKTSDNNNYKVFFSKINSLGYIGNKNATPIYKKDEKGQVIINNHGEQIIDEDFTTSIQDYHTFLARSNLNSDKSFVINSTELNGRLDYNFYCPDHRNLVTNLQKLNAVKLGDIADIIKNKSPLLKETKIVEYVELSDIYTKSFEIINSTTLLASDLPSRASYELKTDDIITAVAGNSIGTEKHATAYVTSQFNHAICTNGFRVLRNIKIDPFYLLYYLQSDLFLKQVFMYRTGAAIPSLSDSDLANILIYLPSEKQMENISLKVKKSFQLRDEAQNEMNKIKSELNINYLLND